MYNYSLNYKICKKNCINIVYSFKEFVLL